MCDACGIIWEHPEHCAGNEAAHTCPDCGAHQWDHHKGAQSTDYRGSCATQNVSRFTKLNITQAFRIL